MQNNPLQSLEKALNEALTDEYKARAIYGKVIEAFGAVRPFVNIVEAEQNHIDDLLPLFGRYGIPVPRDDWAQKVQAPASLLEACEAGVKAEVENAAMYDRLLNAAAEYPDVCATFRRLRAASQNRHLPAFQRCVARESSPNRGGRGGGFGPGSGRGRVLGSGHGGGPRSGGGPGCGGGSGSRWRGGSSGGSGKGRSAGGF